MPGSHSSPALAGQLFSFPLRFIVLPRDWQELSLSRLQEHKALDES